MSTLTRDQFAHRYPTWETFMAAIHGPDAEAARVATSDLSTLLGRDVSGTVAQIRLGANHGGANPYYQALLDELTGQYRQVMGQG